MKRCICVLFALCAGLAWSSEANPNHGKPPHPPHPQGPAHDNGAGGTATPPPKGGVLAVSGTSGTFVQRQLGTTAAPYGYMEYLPPGYAANPGKSYPVWIFLNGAGEYGTGTTDLYDKATTWGPCHEIRYNKTDYPAIVVTPVSPSYWDPVKLNQFVEYLKATYRADADRVYLSGLCTGAGGVMDYDQKFPTQAAGVFPIITQSDPWAADRVVNIPTWVFHGFYDTAMPLTRSRSWVNAIASAVLGSPSDCMATYPYPLRNGVPDTTNSAGSDQTGSFRPASGWSWVGGVAPSVDSQLMLTVYNTGDHNTWQRTVTNPTVLHWAFRQHRQTPFLGAPVALPGRIEAENYDLGGQGRGFFVTAVGAGGSTYRNSVNAYDGTTDQDPVGIADGASGHYLTGTTAGEWLEYTTACTGGVYTLQLSVAAAAAGGRLRLVVSGEPSAPAIPIPATGGADVFTTLAIPGFFLPDGTKKVRLVVEQGGFNLDYAELVVPPGPTDLVVDNRETAHVAISGPWTVSSFTPGFYASDYLSAAPGPLSTATFTPNLPHAGNYEVYIQYPAGSSRGISPVSITYGNGSQIYQTGVDQRTGGGQWNLLGTFPFDAGSAASVTVSNAGASGSITADAVRFHEVPALPKIDLILDNSDRARVTTTGAWATSSSSAGYYGADYLSAVPGSDFTATYRPNLPLAGDFQVSMQYPIGATRGVVQVEIHSAGGQVYTMPVDESHGGGQWNALAAFHFDAGAGSSVVIRTLGATGYTAADAVRFTQLDQLPVQDLVIDDDDKARVTTVGVWNSSTSTAGYYGVDFLSGAPTSDKRVTYRPNLPRAGLFDVYVWYPGSPGRGIAPVTITYGDGTQTAVVSVDERVNGGKWVLLGSFAFDAGLGTSISIGCPNGGGYIAADAVRLRENVPVGSG